jgi:tRNA 2-thiouridine synthesizing protein A
MPAQITRFGRKSENQGCGKNGKAHRRARHRDVFAAYGGQGAGGKPPRRRSESGAGMREIPLDLLGLKCPLPALKTRKALKGLAGGDVLIVTCSDPMSAIDIPNLVRETGDRLFDHGRSEGRLIFRIEKT